VTGRAAQPARSGQSRPDPRLVGDAALVSGRLVAWIGLVAVLAVLAYGSRAAEGKPPHDFVYRYELAVGGLIQYGLVLAVVVAIAWGAQPRALLGLRRPSSWAQAAGLALAVLVAVHALNVGLSPFLDPGREQGLEPSGWDASRALPFALNFAIISLVGPLVEELTFRGLGYSLLERFGRLFAVVAVGLGFALVHGLLEGLPILAAFGSGLAYIRARTGSVYPCIVLHAAFNALQLMLAVTIG